MPPRRTAGRTMEAGSNALRVIAEYLEREERSGPWLERKAGLHPNTIWKLRHQGRDLRYGEAVALAEVMGVSLTYLAGESDH